VAASVLLHATGTAVLYTGWTSAAERFSVSGLQNAIYLEASYATPEAREPVPFESPLDAPRDDSADPTLPPSPALDPLQPAEVSMGRANLILDTQAADPSEWLAADAPVVPRAEVMRATNHDAQQLRVADIVRTPLAKSRTRVEIPSESRIAIQQSAGLDETLPPDFTGNRPPSYPAEAVRRGLEGTVLLRLHISAQGQVERVGVFESSGHELLDQEAVSAVRTWRGQPARRGGQNVSTVELLPIRFRLR